MGKTISLLAMILTLFLSLNFVWAYPSPINCTYPQELDSLWHLDENSTSLTNDECFGIDGVLVGDATWTDGIFESALELDSTGDYVVIQESDTKWAGSNMTVFAWFRLNGVNESKNQLIVARHEAVNKKNFGFGVNGDKLFTETYTTCSSSSYGLGGATALDMGVWYFGTWVIEHGVEKRVYLNGVLDGSTSSVASIPTGCGNFNTSIGSNIRNGDTSFNGTLDDVGLLNKSLNDSEVWELFNAYDSEAPIILEVAPPNETITNETNITFSANTTDNFGLKNATLYIFNESDDLIVVEETPISGTSAFIQDIVNLAQGIYEFFYTVYDIFGNFVSSTVFRLEINETFVAGINITFPVNSTTYFYTITHLDFDISGNPNLCWYSTNLGVTNITTSCTGSIPLVSTQGVNNWAVWTNLTGVGENSTFGDFVTFNSTCTNPNVTLYLTNVLYADVGENYTISIGDFIVDNTNISIDLVNATSTETYQMVYDGISRYTITFIFNEEDDFVYSIYANDNYCPTITQNITGILKARDPFYIGVELYYNDIENNFPEYLNRYAVVTAEFTDERLLEPHVENFLYPISSRILPPEQMFHADYIDGRAELKLWEEDDYFLRIIDGDIEFNSSYAQPTVNDRYGLNTFLGEITTNGSNVTYQYVVDDIDIDQYRWLFNWILIIGLIIVALVSGFLFLSGEYRGLGIGLGAVLSVALIILRIVVLIWLE